MIFKSILGKDFVLTPERKKHILTFHPDLRPYFSKLKDVFLEPDEVRVSKSDLAVLLFYRYFATIRGGKYVTGVIKLGDRSFVLTAYLTNNKLLGEKYNYEKK